MATSGRTTTHDLAALRADFDEQAGKSLALPIAGGVIWAVVCVAAAFMAAREATYVLVFGSAAIFPVGLLVGQLLGAILVDRR